MNGRYEVFDNHTPIVAIMEMFSEDEKQDFFQFAVNEYKTTFQSAMLHKELDVYFQKRTAALFALFNSEKVSSEQGEKLIDRLLPSIHNAWAIVKEKVHKLDENGLATATPNDFRDWFYILYIAHKSAEIEAEKRKLEASETKE